MPSRKTSSRGGGLTAALASVDARLAERIREMYQETIERGAHPNVEGVSLSSEYVPMDGDRYAISTVFIHGDEAVLLATLDLLRAMELLYCLLELTIGTRLRVLAIDLSIDEGRRTVIRLIEQCERESARR